VDEGARFDTVKIDQWRLKERELMNYASTMQPAYQEVVYKVDPVTQNELELCCKENGELKKEVGL
jgi:hypothetical protein